MAEVRHTCDDLSSWQKSTPRVAFLPSAPSELLQRSHLSVRSWHTDLGGAVLACRSCASVDPGAVSQDRW
jgi:hypothetical protein